MLENVSTLTLIGELIRRLQAGDYDSHHIMAHWYYCLGLAIFHASIGTTVGPFPLAPAEHDPEVPEAWMIPQSEWEN
jgi:hypothetical protein